MDDQTQSILIRNRCIEVNSDFLNYLDDKGRIMVKMLREKSNLRYLYKIYNRLSVNHCRNKHRFCYNSNVKTIDTNSRHIESSDRSTFDCEPDVKFAVEILISIANLTN